MKQLYNLFLLTAAAALAFSCSKPDNGENPDNGETPETVILLSEDEITADADGGNFIVQWEVENPVEGTEYSVNASEEWIENLDWENMGTINFSIPANTSKEAREGMITIEYGAVCSDTINVRQEGREVSYPAPEDIIGVWKVIGDRWDLDNGESSCYLMDDESEDGYAHDENGNYIIITVREYCEQYARDWNADPANGTEGTAEDFADKLYEDIGLAGTFTVDGSRVSFDWGLELGFSALYVDGEYKYNAAEGYMQVDDRAIESDPRDLRIDVFTDENGRMCFRYPEFYIMSMYNYDQTEEYWIYAPTIFYCEKSTAE